VRLLLDTLALLWFIWGNARLSSAARLVMADPANVLLVSMGSFWEIAIKVSVGKLKLAVPFEEFANDAIADNDLTILPIDVRHTAAVVSLPFHHRDPFDRLLVAQAIEERIPIVSSDTVFDSYAVTRLW
jgi:PIN domain nuclease of toxin-antitoxin system